MTVTFQDYESAVQYAKEKAEALWSLQKEGLEEEQEYTYSAGNIDGRNVYIQITVTIDAYQKGVVTIVFLENTPNTIEDSIYFDFS